LLYIVALNLSFWSLSFSNSSNLNSGILSEKINTVIINESFESVTFPPAGWIKINPITGSTGWNRQTTGILLPGFSTGVVTSPVSGGSAVAFCNYITGSNNGSGGPSDQWLITPQILNVQPTDSLTFWLRKMPLYIENFEVKISTTTPTISAMTTVLMSQNFLTTDTGWIQYKFNINNLVPAGSNIYIGLREYIADVTHDGATFSLDLVKYIKTNTGIILNNNEIPEKYFLGQNFPNPFNPSTKIRFEIPKGDIVKLVIYDIMGKEVIQLINEYKQPGVYTFTLDCSTYSNGVYFYSISTGGFNETRKMLIVK
jgi:hypothetical protein